ACPAEALAKAGLFDLLQHPEISAERRIQHVGIGHCAVAMTPPAAAPRVAYEEALALLVIADRQHGVAAENGFVPRRHRHDAGRRHPGALEALVDGESEDERIARGQAAAQFRLGLLHA